MKGLFHNTDLILILIVCIIMDIHVLNFISGLHLLEKITFILYLFHTAIAWLIRKN